MSEETLSIQGWQATGAVPPVPPVNDQPTIFELQQQLETLVARQTSRTAWIGGMFELQLKRSGILACAVFHRDANGKLTRGAFRARCELSPDDGLHAWLAEACDQAIRSGRPQVIAVPDQCRDAVFVPLREGNVTVLATLVKRRDRNAEWATDIALTLLCATNFAAWHNRRKLAELSDHLSATAATLELVQRVESSEGLTAACLTIAADLKQHLQCEQVIVGIVQRDNTCRVMAVSDVSQIDQQADATRKMKAVLDECVLRDEISCWPPLPGVSSHRLLAHRQFARRDCVVISTPLRSPDGKPIGALTVVGQREWAAIPPVHRFIATLDEPLGSSLQAVKQADGGWLRRISRTLLARRHTKKRWLAAGLALIAMAILLLPVPYRIRCRCVTEPVERRFCVAPHDGLLESTFAAAGDVVDAGQTLARMDGRETRWELAGLIAEMNRAAKKRDMHMARHETTDALLAELEMKRLDSRSQLLRFRESSLAIKSPIAGIVLSGSLDRHENFPVTKGQVLYEVAPLDAVRIEVSVPAEDIIHVRPEMSVCFMFDGLGDQTFTGYVKAVRPRAEIRDEENVFVAEVVVRNDSGQLRPGMQGYGKIVADRQSVGWIVFHRAWEHAQTIWPW